MGAFTHAKLPFENGGSWPTVAAQAGSLTVRIRRAAVSGPDQYWSRLRPRILQNLRRHLICSVALESHNPTQYDVADVWQLEERAGCPRT